MFCGFCERLVVYFGLLRWFALIGLGFNGWFLVVCSISLLLVLFCWFWFSFGSVGLIVDGVCYCYLLCRFGLLVRVA